jgi:hypothetical protein
MKNLSIAAAATAVLSPLALLAGPAAAQSQIEMVSAGNPAELTAVMMNAGYDVELTVDKVGVPMIKSELSGMPLRIYFYGCNEQTHDGCDSVQLSTGFDRQEPWTPAAAMQISESLRFASVRLDDEGDPFVTWDIVTGSGIPGAVFLESISQFKRTIQLTADIVFAEEQGQ